MCEAKFGAATKYPVSLASSGKVASVPLKERPCLHNSPMCFAFECGVSSSNIFLNRLVAVFNTRIIFWLSIFERTAAEWGVAPHSDGHGGSWLRRTTSTAVVMWAILPRAAHESLAHVS